MKNINIYLVFLILNSCTISVDPNFDDIESIGCGWHDPRLMSDQPNDTCLSFKVDNEHMAVISVIKGKNPTPCEVKRTECTIVCPGNSAWISRRIEYIENNQYIKFRPGVSCDW